VKKFVALIFALLLFAIPETAQAQQKKNNNQDNQNPLVFIAGIFSAVNCIITCGGTTSTVVTAIVIPQSEGPPIIRTGSATSRVYGAYVGGALACTFLWPFINHFAGGPEPTSEQAAQIMLSCWVPGLGLLLYLQNQYAP